MTKEEMLKKIQELEQELANEKRKHYETNLKLNEALLELSAYQEKYGIERAKQILPKTEKIEKLNNTINEVEEVIKEEKKQEKLIKERNIKSQALIMKVMLVKQYI